MGVINTTDYWVGYLGLGIKPTNFTDANQPTFLTTLVENRSLIPSHSYGYTAGAYYSKLETPAFQWIELKLFRVEECSSFTHVRRYRLEQV